MKKTTEELWQFDRQLLADGVRVLAGIDEAGRGPLAGPVVAAVAIMPLNEKFLVGINDSKLLSESRREALFERIVCTATDYAVVAVDAERIDEINILNATKQAMTQCIENLSVRPDKILTDAVTLKGYAVTPIVHGDGTSYSIAAASILAKVTRDRMMREYAQRYPQYGFEKHKGYGKIQHIDALQKYGICPLHRKTFLKNFSGIKGTEQ